MLQFIPDFVPPYADLLKLASTPFSPAQFRNQCETFSRYSKSESFEDLWYFRLPSTSPTLVVSVEVDDSQTQGTLRQTRVRFAVLPFVGWDDFIGHEDTDVRAQFDEAFATALATASESIGPPTLETTYGRHQFRRAVWTGSTGVLLLQQSDYDPQFGAEIHCCLQSHDEQSPFHIKQSA